jgi:hypothetical protein
MKRISIKWVAVMTTLLSLTSCQKEQAVDATNHAEVKQASIPTKNTQGGIYMLSVDAVGHKSFLYKGGLAPTSVVMGQSGVFSISGTTVTYANGLAYQGGFFWITTGSLSNFPNRLMKFNSSLVFQSAALLTNPNISHLEYSTALGGFFALDAVGFRINKVLTTGVCVAAGPVLNPGAGYHLSGLTDYNDPSTGFGIAVAFLDNTAGVDKIVGVNLSTNAVTGIASNSFTPCTTLGLGLQYSTTGFYSAMSVSTSPWFYNVYGSGVSPAISSVSPLNLPIQDMTATF